MNAVRGPLYGQGPVCDHILHALPDWFGIEESIVQYIREVDDLPTFVAYEGEAAVGFLSVKQHFPRTAEVYVMGVLVDQQGQGLGSALMRSAEAYLRTQGVRYLQVKTLAASHPDEYYMRTRAYYLKMGFEPLEDLNLWGADNPCLLLVKQLGEEE